MKRSIGIGLLGVLVVILGTAGSCLAASPPAKNKTCPYGNGYSDGCHRAYPDGNFMNSNFFAYAKQSGQGSYYSAPGTPSSHPPPWNVAGVDYPVGYGTSRALKDPAVAPLPAGCSYSATGSPNGGAIVTCSHVDGLKLRGWDFSLHNCTVLDIKNSVSGTISIRNNKFVNGSNCSRQNGYLVTVENHAAANFIFMHNYLDGDVTHYPASMTALVAPYVSGTVTIRYNALLHCPCRPISSNTGGALLVANNYIDGFVYSSQDGHGEVFIDAFQDFQTQPSVIYSFNTVLEPNDVCVNCGAAIFFVTNGQPGATIAEAQIDHNTTVVNLNGGKETVAAASAETAYNMYGSVLFQGNYVDPTGSYQCFIDTGNAQYDSAPVFTDNVNMLSGITIPGYGKC